ncbi:MAG: thermonuclease family protein [Gammaproteobacteria bacterium]|nr:thermonuclease family protein [Gammaproteobacteria bacterium]
MTPPAKDEPVEETTQEARLDRGLIGVDYAGVNPLTIAAEALVRSIKALSNLLWISIAGTVATIFLATLASLDGAADGMLGVGEYDIPLSVLPIACLSFAMFLLWLTAARLKMLDVALADQDLTAGVARDIFRLDPPVLDVFEAGNLRPFALLSGFSVVLWNWSLFFGSSIGLIFSATMIRGASTSVDTSPAFLVYAAFALAIMIYGAASIVPLLGRILERLHGERLKVGPARIALALVVVIAGVALANPDLPRVMTQSELRTVGPSRANAINGETLILERGEIVVLAGIAALRPGQTCWDGDGAPYPCGDQATVYLQSIVRDIDVFCFVYYPNLGICLPIPEGSTAPENVGDVFNARNLQARMVAAGLAFVEGEGAEFMGELQDQAQRYRVGAWQGAFQPPGRWTGTR